MTASERPAVLPAPWLLAFTALSAAPVLRIGDVQLLEIAQLLSACAAAAWFARAGFRARVPKPWREYGGLYAILLSTCAAGALFALRLDFYPPPDTSALKEPLVLSIARLVELALAMYAMLAAASALQRDMRLLRLALDVYLALAAATAFASILSWCLLEGGEISTPFVYGFDNRVRGLFNEGGPYGMFLVSAGVAAILRARLGRVGQASACGGLQSPCPPGRPEVGRRLKPAPLVAARLVLFAVALVLSGSKAGLLAAVLLSGIGAMSSATRRQKAVLLFAGAAILTITAVLFQSKFLTYWLLYEHVEEAAAYHPGDPNYVMGRVTGALIVPRMVAAHPVGGVGLGNYSLMRNDPQYLQGLPPAEEWDLPGMGLLGDAAELGGPLALFLFTVLLRPFWKAARLSHPQSVAVAAAFQPVALLLGVNLNFFYPWLMTAFALASEPLT